MPQRSVYAQELILNSNASKKEQRSASGFTLLELLIAITLLVLIVAIAMGALRLSARSLEAGDRRMEAHERLRNVLIVMDAQIQSQLPLTYELETTRSYYFRGAAKNLRMITNYSIWGGRQGQVLVDYVVEAGEGSKETLYASEQTPGMEGTRTTALFKAATEISFQYYHREQPDEAGEWSDEWNDELAIPAGIRINVTSGAKKSHYLFPLRVPGNVVKVPLTPVTLKGLKK